MRRRNLMLAGTLVVSSVFGGVFGDRVLAKDESQQKAKERFARTLDLIELNYATPVESNELVEGAIRGMLQTLDPHSSYLEAKAYRQMRDEQRGSFSGLGIVVTKKGEQLTVISPIEDTPAYRLGIRGGDVISHIEGEETREMSLDAAVSKLKGPKGTTVNITITRSGSEPFDVSVVRDDIPTKSLARAFMIRPGIGYVRIKNFTQTTASELDEALAELETQDMKALLLDLRNNPGGLLDQAVKVSSKFLPKGHTVVFTKGRLADSNQSFAANGEGHTDFPVVVLVNKYSASASEIVAGAIQDHDRGLIVGETTWGKGLVQTVFSLKYNAGLALTTAKYYTPSGRCIQRDFGDADSAFEEYYDHDKEPVLHGPDDEFATDVGRPVYGGGGIQPDAVIEPRKLTDFEERLLRDDVYFKYAVDYRSKHPQVARDFAADDEAVEGFRQMILAEKVEFSPEQWIESSEQIRARIAEYVVSNAFGLDVAYRIRVESDEQVRKALEYFPQAMELASIGIRAGEAGSLAPGAKEPSVSAVQRD